MCRPKQGIAKLVVGLSFDELAYKLGISYKGVAAVYYRAIQKLRSEMEDLKR